MRAIKEILIVVWMVALASGAKADSGVIVYVPSGCDYFAVNSLKGIAVLEWFGGHLPSKDDKIVGDFDGYGFKDIYVLPNGAEMHVWVEDYLLSVDHATSILSDKCPH